MSSIFSFSRWEWPLTSPTRPLDKNDDLSKTLGYLSAGEVKASDACFYTPVSHGRFPLPLPLRLGT